MLFNERNTRMAPFIYSRAPHYIPSARLNPPALISKITLVDNWMNDVFVYRKNHYEMSCEKHGPVSIFVVSSVRDRTIDKHSTRIFRVLRVYNFFRFRLPRVHHTIRRLSAHKSRRFPTPRQYRFRSYFPGTMLTNSKIFPETGSRKGGTQSPGQSSLCRWPARNAKRDVRKRCVPVIIRP